MSVGKLERPGLSVLTFETVIRIVGRAGVADKRPVSKGNWDVDAALVMLSSSPVA